MKSTPEFFILSSAQCAKFLARNHVGRLAFRNGKRVDIEPLGYVAGKDWLFMRSAPGSKLQALARDPFVAFEVDEIDGPFDWRSVVAHGTIYVLPKVGSPIDQRQFDRALRALRRAMPGTLTEEDPVPERQVIYGLHVDRLEGRMARSRPARRPARRAKPSRRRRARTGR